MRTLAWTLAGLLSLGGIALAEPAPEGAPSNADELGVSIGGSHRGIAQDYLVLPSGGELTGQMRFVMADPALGGERLKFTDLALFGLAGRWSLLEKLEVSANVTLLPKQPSDTNEKVWQSVGLGLRSPLGRKVAIAISGAGGHLMSHQGSWTRAALALEWRKPIARVLDFGISGGVDGIALTAPRETNAFLGEVSISTTALFREPSGLFGSWIGLGYALPVAAHGADPTTGLALDPQPRLDFRIGMVLSLVRQWDLFTEFAVIDRGDLKDPATRLPLLDGGFDQRQVIFGVTRHLEGRTRRPTSNYNDDDDDQRLSLGDPTRVKHHPGE